MAVKPHFEVDRKGLAKILERRGKSFALLELVQNALDEDVSEVNIQLDPVPGRPQVHFVVLDDDPDGFTDLRHAYTLYAESEKKSDATKRGRFNLGEKLVIAVCQELTIATTTGTVVFTDVGRQVTKAKRSRGSRVDGIMAMTRDEMQETLDVLRTVLVPEGVLVTLNNETLKPRKPVESFEVTLPTEVADEDGNLKATARKTTVTLHDPRPGETPHIYELGIPVVETDLPWHIDVQQKVPVNMDRDNVTPAYRRILIRHVTEHMHEDLDVDTAASPWVDDALADPEISTDAVDSLLTHRFGEKRVIYDPSDREANKRAAAAGYTVMPGGSFNRQQWENIRRSGTQAAGKVTPSPKPWSEDPNAPQADFIDKSDWTPEMKAMASFAQELAEKLMNRYVAVSITRTSNYFAACYGHGELTFNLQRLGHAWFAEGPSVRVIDLLIHEFGHEYESDHLSTGYYKALTRLGAKAVRLAIDEPRFFKKHERAFERIAQAKLHTPA